MRPIAPPLRHCRRAGQHRQMRTGTSPDRPPCQNVAGAFHARRKTRPGRLSEPDALSDRRRRRRGDRVLPAGVRRQAAHAARRAGRQDRPCRTGDRQQSGHARRRASRDGGAGAADGRRHAGRAACLCRGCRCCRRQGRRRRGRAETPGREPVLWRPARLDRRSVRASLAPIHPCRGCLARGDRPPRRRHGPGAEAARPPAMIPRERTPYSAIVDRPPLNLPGGARLVVWTIVNLEFWDISRPMARQVLPAPSGQVLLPDVPNWSWHEYGMRVGVWRFFDLFRRLQIRPTLSINARVCEDYERVARAAHEAGWEFMGHAYEQGPVHLLDDQKAMIERSVGVIERFTGEKPVGWLGPGLTQTYDTPELLAAAGIKYIGDWVYDDEPTEIATANGPLVTLPYTVELNDIPMMLVQHHESEYFTRRCIDTFDRLYQEGAKRAKIMAIAIHPYISGQPHRIKSLEAVYDHVNRYAGVLHWNGVEILDWYMSTKPRE